LKIRPAAKVDKEGALKFCIDTFEWGDYIDQVWDLWYSAQEAGLLLVAEEEEEEYNLHNKKQSSTVVIALSHVSLCPNNKNKVWLEGIRVHPNYRRRGVATQLLNRMISYGREQGAKEAYAMVAQNNIASQLMMESNGFAVISKWSYYSIDKIPKKVDKVKLRCKVATIKDTEMIRNYLRQSEVYKSSGETYVNSWRWCSLDLYSNTLTDLIKNDKVVIMTGNDDDDDQIEGLAIINKENNKDNNNNNNNIFQIVYIDASSALALKDIMSFAINLIHSHKEDVIYDRIQVYSPQTTRYVSKVIEEVVGIEEERSKEQFLLYKREISNIPLNIKEIVP
jgi:ribosomal protein S18 acetylase RimI-like enzyme